MIDTRVIILNRLMNWVMVDPMSLFWLAGMTGTGKTSIALTLCRMLATNRSVILGGTFFCSRSAGSIARTKVQCILPTLAASLARRFPEFADALSAELDEEPLVAHKPVHEQIVPLLLKPLAKLPSTTKPVVFVIDALDECSDANELVDLITGIAEFKSDVSVKFILTSRPEMRIRGTAIANPDHNTIFQLHMISQEEVEADIRRYITGTLQASKHPTGWYSDEDVDALVGLSHGLFIYAATVLRYIMGRENVTDCVSRLRRITSAAPAGSAATTSLYTIYEIVMLGASQGDILDEIERLMMQRVIACILAARRSLSVQALADLLGDEVDRVRGSLERLHSVVFIPIEDAIPGLRMLHASFGDYLTSPETAANIRIGPSLGDDALARGCLQVMAMRLVFDISHSRSSYEPNLPTKSDNVTLAIEYACMEWIYHVSRLTNPSILDQDIYDLFRWRFMSWLEVMSSCGQVKRAAEMLELAVSTVRT